MRLLLIALLFVPELVMARGLSHWDRNQLENLAQDLTYATEDLVQATNNRYRPGRNTRPGRPPHGGFGRTDVSLLRDAQALNQAATAFEQTVYRAPLFRIKDSFHAVQGMTAKLGRRIHSTHTSYAVQMLLTTCCSQSRPSSISCVVLAAAVVAAAGLLLPLLLHQ